MVGAALIAAHLDHRMLVDHDPSVFLSLLSKAHAEEIAGRGFTAPHKEYDPSAIPAVTDTEPDEAYFQPDHTLDIADGRVG